MSGRQIFLDSLYQDTSLLPSVYTEWESIRSISILGLRGILPRLKVVPKDPVQLAESLEMLLK
jgi:hypothetical protein